MFRDRNQVSLSNLEDIYRKFSALIELVACVGAASSDSIYDVSAMCDLLYSVGDDALRDFERELFQGKEVKS